MNKNNIFKVSMIFGLGSFLFPNLIRVSNLFTLILVIFSFIGLDFLFIKFMSFLINKFKYSKILPMLGIFMFIVGFLWFPIKISIMESLISGFSISGTLTMVILWFLLTNFKVYKNDITI